MKTVKNLIFSVALATGVAISGLVPCQGFADDWTQWRGPNRSDNSNETGLLKEWPSNGPDQVWLNKDTGLGYGGIAVADGTIFTVGSRDDQEFAIALSAKDGKEVWSTVIGPLLKNNWGDGPRSTPTIDGDFVYALSAQGHLACLDRKTGKVAWKQAMEDVGGNVPFWGYSESPLVDENRVVVTPGGDQGAIVAFDKISGKQLWQSKNITDPANYSSIIIATPNGQKQYVQLMPKQVIGVSPETGEMLWTSPWQGRTAVIPTPIAKDNFIYISSGYGVGCKLIEISKDNQATDVYQNKVMKNHHGGVLLVGDKLFGYSDGAGWTCQDFKSGDSLWEEEELGKGSVTYADGCLYLLDEKSGEVVLAEASDAAWREKGRFTLSPQTEQRSRSGGIWTHPVIANGYLYLKDQEILYCYKITK